jgi:hypothetical protein
LGWHLVGALCRPYGAARQCCWWSSRTILILGSCGRSPGFAVDCKYPLSRSSWLRLSSWSHAPFPKLAERLRLLGSNWPSCRAESKPGHQRPHAELAHTGEGHGLDPLFEAGHVSGRSSRGDRGQTRSLSVPFFRAPRPSTLSSLSDHDAIFRHGEGLFGSCISHTVHLWAHFLPCFL